MERGVPSRPSWRVEPSVSGLYSSTTGVGDFFILRRSWWVLLEEGCSRFPEPEASSSEENTSLELSNEYRIDVDDARRPGIGAESCSAVCEGFLFLMYESII